MSKSKSNPTIIIVPGGFHLPSAYHLLEEQLQAADYKVICVGLPSIGSDVVHSNADGDIAAVREAIVDESDDGKDVVLVMHSYGGFPGSEAVKGLSKPERSQHGLAGGVIHLFYISAFILDVGKSVSTAWQDFGLPIWTVPTDDTWTTVKVNGDGREHLYNDITDEKLIAEQSSALQEQSAGPILQVATHAPWKYIPSTYLFCELDQALPPSAQTSLISQEGAKFNVVRFKTGHSPFLGRPADTARAIIAAAESSTSAH